MRSTAAVALTVALALLATACTATDEPSPTAAPPGEERIAGPGGTLRWLNPDARLAPLDPQRVYDSEYVAFTTAFLFRPLTSYVPSEDAAAANEVVGDLATDAGSPTKGGTEWSFTVRKGVRWEDGSRVRCEDVKYGVSRSFATDEITNGPPYALSYLDIPPDPLGGSAYKGPYSGIGQAFFDRAVRCDGNTITFVLGRPVADFNAATTLPLFSPVPRKADSGADYGDSPQSTGPYRLAERVPGKRLSLVRKESWRASSDPLRPAYPDDVEVSLGVDPAEVTQGMRADDPGYQPAVTTVPISASQGDAGASVAGRSWQEYSGFVYYLAVDTSVITATKHRQALLALVDRDAVVEALGGPSAASSADGVLSPNLALDYRPTELWEGLLGKPVPEQGDPSVAQRLIEQAKGPMPVIRLAFPSSPAERAAALAFAAAAERAGISIQTREVPVEEYYETVLEDSDANVIFAAWRPDWSNASRTIPDLFAERGGFNLSNFGQPRFQDDIRTAQQTLARAKQAQRWGDINVEAARQGLTVPLAFLRSQRLWGSDVINAYHWAPYGTWSWSQLAVVDDSLAAQEKDGGTAAE